MQKWKVNYTNRFKKDLKKYKYEGKKLKLIQEAVNLLAEHGALGLPKSMRVHKLSGRYDSFWECHILPDVLLIWEEFPAPLSTIYLIRCGSHSELF